jgi:hypothetical protein
MRAVKAAGAALKQITRLDEEIQQNYSSIWQGGF